MDRQYVGIDFQRRRSVIVRKNSAGDKLSSVRVHRSSPPPGSGPRPRAWRRVLDEYDRVVERLVTAHRGRLIKTLGDGILATFDGPATAVRCASAIRDSQAERGIAVRSGLHTGEIELRNDDIAGIAVHLRLASPRSRNRARFSHREPSST